MTRGRNFLLAILVLALATPRVILPEVARAGDVPVIDNPDRGRWDDTPGKTFQILENMLLGSEDGDDAFGRIAAVAVDSRGRIIVLDGGFVTVKVYDPDAMTMTSVGGKGQGPGEFSLPTALGIDNQDRIYVADYGGRVSIFLPTGEFDEQFRHEFPGGGVATAVKTGPGGTYLSWFDAVDRKIVHRYDNRHHYLASFADAHRPADPAEAASPMYNGGSIDLDAEGNVYFTQWTPYEVRKYSPGGELLLTIHRKNDFMRPPKIEKTGDVTTFHTCPWSVSIIVLPDGRFLNIVMIPPEDGGVPMRTIVDLFDHDGVLLKTRELHRAIAFQCIDRDGFVYARGEREYPVVIRYELQIPK